MEVDGDEDLPNTPPEVKEAAHLVTLELLPLKSRARYKREYDMFMRWRQEKKNEKLFRVGSFGVHVGTSQSAKIIDFMVTIFDAESKLGCEQ
jgi:hypothetical protein